MWRGPGFLEICHTRAYQPCLCWVGHWCQANAKWQTRTNIIFETLGGLGCQGSEQVRGKIFCFCFCQFFAFCFTLPDSFLPLDYPPFFHSFRLFFLSFLLFSFHSCFPSVFCIPLSSPTPPVPPSLLDWLASRAAIANGSVPPLLQSSGSCEIMAGFKNWLQKPIKNGFCSLAAYSHQRCLAL